MMTKEGGAENRGATAVAESGEEAPVARLVTFLGTGKYCEVTYRFGEREAPKTPYVCRALAALFNPAEIVILATEQAEQCHGTNLITELRASNHPVPRFVRIPVGRDPAELWRQFDVIKRQLRGSDGSVMLDITHGFRSQPFFAAAISAFVRAVDEQPPDLRICYGAYDAKDKTGLAPVWELTGFVTLLDWAQALRLFLRTGRAQEAALETKRLGRALARAWAEGGQQGPRPDLDKLGEALRQFGADVETLRTGDLLIGRSKRSSTAALYHSAQQARDHVTCHAPPLADVLDRVVGMVEPLAGDRDDLSGDAGRKAVVALADLYLRLGRYLEATATVREGWINFYAGKAALCPGGKGFDKHERDRAEQRARAHDKNFQAVADRRNDFLHAQYRPSTQKATEIIGTTKNLVEKFKAAAQTPRGSCFVNLSNHPSGTWEAQQTAAALAVAERITDIPFPAFPPESDETMIETLAEECVRQVPQTTTHALIQGEFTLTFELVRRLQARRIVCVAATSERQVEAAGDGRKTSTFRFVRFRAYPSPGDDDEVQPKQAGTCKCLS